MTITTKLNIGDTFWIPFYNSGEIVPVCHKVEKIGILDKGIMYYLGKQSSWSYHERLVFKTKRGAKNTCYEKWKNKMAELSK